MNRTLLGFIRKEFAQALRDPRMRVMLFLVPCIQMTVFGVAISNEVKNIRLASFYPPGDTLSRQVVERCLASGWFIDASGGDPDPFHLIQSRQAEVVWVAPPKGLTSALGKGQAPVQLLINAVNVVRAQQIEVFVRSILSSVLVDNQFATVREPPFKFEVRVLYNPTAKTSIYMVPAVICMILCLVTTVLTSMSLAKEKEIGTFETLIAAPVKTWEIIVGKTLPYIVLGLTEVPLLICLAVFGFGVPLRGQVWMLGASAFVFICTTVSIGILISTFARSQQQAMLGGFLFLFPAIMLSGIIYPVENMPTYIKVFAYLDPLKYFVSLMRNIMLKGGGSGLVFNNIAVLSGMAVFCMLVSFRRFKHTL